MQGPQAPDDVVQQIFGGRRPPGTLPLGIPHRSPLMAFGISLDVAIGVRVALFIGIPLNDTRDVMMTPLMSFGKGPAAEWS
ncbi:hypothetical protein Sgleb_52650 [Streptomyces glebosus]|uniref:Uncharacterized protein n=1 Tax=Streptomyces glebosus TaxID=249580 RepID=A0A640T1N3_9ACTN|nr:hypothetical protein Sgleb_52650 [Streptomyces glebosus]GHG54116.1 hypothetical protein GCM10010513_15570 [Streptomyces glebosus]